MAIDINGAKKSDDAYEVELKFTVTTQQDETSAFVIELVYAGLFAVQNMSEETVQPFLHIQAPFILFPFARRVIADVTRDGGYPPLMLDPIDFTSLYQHRGRIAAGALLLMPPIRALLISFGIGKQTQSFFTWRQQSGGGNVIIEGEYKKEDGNGEDRPGIGKTG